MDIDDTLPVGKLLLPGLVRLTALTALELNGYITQPAAQALLSKVRSCL